MPECRRKCPAAEELHDVLSLDSTPFGQGQLSVRRVIDSENVLISVFHLRCMTCEEEPMLTPYFDTSLPSVSARTLSPYRCVKYKPGHYGKRNEGSNDSALTLAASFLPLAAAYLVPPIFEQLYAIALYDFGYHCEFSPPYYHINAYLAFH